MVVYDTKFNLNEWFIIIGLIATFLLLFFLPRRFPVTITVLVLLFCTTVGIFIDHTWSVKPYDLYDVNDDSNYTFMDFLTYFLYAPIGYFFLYAYDRWKPKGGYLATYIVACSLLSVGFEWISIKANIFYYKGYSTIYSFPIYVAAQCVTLLFYKKISAIYAKSS